MKRLGAGVEAVDGGQLESSRRVFISYRRADTAHVAGRLFDRLESRYGQGNVFMDADSIEPGQDFAEAIQGAVGACDVLLALIGNRWLDAADKHNHSRLEDPNDFVVLEITTALQRRIRVIPVLVDGAEPPRRGDLPDSLTPLTLRQGIGLGHTTFGRDVTALFATLERQPVGKEFNLTSNSPHAPDRNADRRTPLSHIQRTTAQAERPRPPNQYDEDHGRAAADPVLDCAALDSTDGGRRTVVDDSAAEPDGSAPESNQLEAPPQIADDGPASTQQARIDPAQGGASESPEEASGDLAISTQQTGRGKSPYGADSSTGLSSARNRDESEMSRNLKSPSTAHLNADETPLGPIRTRITTRRVVLTIIALTLLAAITGTWIASNPTDLDEPPSPTTARPGTAAVTWEEISSAAKAAMICALDPRFFQNDGLDWTEGDTITQRYIRNYRSNVAATNDNDRVIDRGPIGWLRETRAAISLNGRMSKAEILTGYLNTVFLGNEAYGIEAASRIYFGTTPGKLSISQAALLAGIADDPQTYDPRTHPQAVFEQRNSVIDSMAAQGSITGQQSLTAKTSPLGLRG